MNDHEVGGTSVLQEIGDAFAGVTMSVPVGDIVAAGRSRRRHRRVGKVAGVVAVAGLALGVATQVGSGAGTSEPRAGDVHIRTIAYTVDSQADGSVKVEWSKERYFQDPDGLQAALHDAGFPVLIKVGEFCQGPDDDGYLSSSGRGHGVDAVMRGSRRDDDTVVFTFVPSAVPAGMQLFIGYLTPAEQAATGHLGSVERLVPTSVPLTCTTEAPRG